MNTKGTRILDENKNLSLYKNYLEDFIAYLEKFPVQDNFYENLKNVSIKFIISSDMTISKNRSAQGLYNVKNNEITINVSKLKKISSKKTLEKFWDYFYKTILHELTHMASAKYNAKNKVHSSGFVESDKGYFHGALALTEGMTDLIAYNYYGQNKMMSGYALEMLIVMQLMQIIGEDVLIESYFNNYGLDEIRSELERIDASKKQVDDLFAKLSTYFYNKKKETTKYEISQIELILARYFMRTIEVDMRKNTSVDEIMEKINLFESTLITSRVLEKLRLNKDKYPNIDKALNELKNMKKIIKEEYKEAKVK